MFLWITIDKKQLLILFYRGVGRNNDVSFGK